MKLFKKLKAVLLAVGSISSLGIAVSSQSITPVHAGFCGGVGTSGMVEKAVPIDAWGISEWDLGNRKYTLTELFDGNSSTYAVPYGHRKKSWFGILAENEFKKAPKPDGEEKKKIEARGEDLGCVFSGFQPMIQNVSKTFADMFVGLINTTIGLFFNKDFICADPDKPTGGCINLLGIAGGKTGDKDGGLIGSMSRGVFQPLAAVAFLMVAIWLIHNGLYKREFRTSFGGLIWAFIAFIMGIFVLVNPQQVARAPQAINSVISGCVLEVLNGGDCMSGSSGQPKQGDDIACKAYSGSANANQRTQMVLSELSCNVTKAFSIDRWSEQQFGYRFDELYTMNSPTGQNYTKIAGSAGNYCVPMYTNAKPRQLNGANFSDGQYEVCNIAAAYMALRTNANFHVTASMEHIVATALKDDAMWGSFTGQGRDMSGATSIISAFAAAIAFLPVTFYGLAYSLTSTLLVIWAPIFLLLAIHPGRGKQIFLGWLEALIGSFLKYMASGLLVIVMFSVFSAVISELNAFSGMVVTIILAFTFRLYRKELINLMGTVNLGGVKIANRASEALDKIGDKSERFTKSTVGGAVGGLIAGAGSEDMTALDGMRKGMAAATMKELKHGRGMVANVARGFDSTSKQNIKDRKEKDKQILDDGRFMATAGLIQENAKTSGSQAKRNNLSELKEQGINTAYQAAGALGDRTLQQEAMSAAELVRSSKSASSASGDKENVMLNTKVATEMASETRIMQESLDNSQAARNNGRSVYADDLFISKYENHNSSLSDKYAKEIENSEEFQNATKHLTQAQRDEIMADYRSKANELISDSSENVKSNMTVSRNADGSESVVEFNSKAIADERKQLEEALKNLKPEIKDPKSSISGIHPLPSSGELGNLPPISPSGGIEAQQSVITNRQETSDIVNQEQTITLDEGKKTSSVSRNLKVNNRDQVIIDTVTAQTAANISRTSLMGSLPDLNSTSLNVDSHLDSKFRDFQNNDFRDNLSKMTNPQELKQQLNSTNFAKGDSNGVRDKLYQNNEFGFTEAANDIHAEMVNQRGWVNNQVHEHINREFKNKAAQLDELKNDTLETINNKTKEMKTGLNDMADNFNKDLNLKGTEVHFSED